MKQPPSARSSAVVLNQYGYFELANKPTAAELQQYYADRYYQEDRGHYSKSYPESELEYIDNRIAQKSVTIAEVRGVPVAETGSLLDVGCGEGFTLAHFRRRRWSVEGIDYSDFGCRLMNPDCLPFLIQGDVDRELERLADQDRKYDVVWLDNVLEHALDPMALLRKCRLLMRARSVLVIEVPNDFSVLQRHLLENGHIESEFWITVPDHISYFNAPGLSKLLAAAGLRAQVTLGDYPIDLNLVNPDTNYVRDRPKGRNAHLARVEVENLLHSISPEKTLALWKSLGDLGLGRLIISFATIADA